MTTRTLKVDQLARVEGEGALTIRYQGDAVRDVELRIFEPPRLFEALLRGRAGVEAPDITARICGICPVAHQLTACRAVEDALGVTVDGTLRALRRLIYLGEWIESHVLHVFMLHAPDFLGHHDALALAKVHPEPVRRGLRMKKAGNALVAVLGGREIHPVNVRVGGFYRAPSRAQLDALLPELRWSREAALDALEWMKTFEFPSLDRDYELVALRHPDEYPLVEGRLVSNKGLDIAPAEWDAHFVEEQVPHSTALHARLRARGTYLCGPLARFSLNHERLRPIAREAAARAGLRPPCTNPFRSLLVRLVETIHAFDEACEIIARYAPPPRPSVPVAARAGTGHACTEAPRGVLYHRYALDEAGAIRDARIVPPTSQNQRAIEDDLRALAPSLLALDAAAATRRAEHAIRNHDPCISCATHFLTLRLERDPCPSG